MVEAVTSCVKPRASPRTDALDRVSQRGDRLQPGGPRRRQHVLGSLKLWRYALDGIFSFTVKPLKVWGVIGVLISLLSFVYAALIVLRTWSLVSTCRVTPH